MAEGYYPWLHGGTRGLSDLHSQSLLKGTHPLRDHSWPIMVPWWVLTA